MTLDGSSHKILIVEDEEEVRVLLTGILATKGYHVLATDNITDAEEMIANNKDIRFALLDMDVFTSRSHDRIPGKNTTLALMPLLTQLPACTIVAGSALEENCDLLVDAGAHKRLPKPFRPSEFLRIIENA